MHLQYRKTTALKENNGIAVNARTDLGEFYILHVDTSRQNSQAGDVPITASD